MTKENDPFTQFILTQATLSELNIILYHVKLGKAHLQKHLNPDQLHNLLDARKTGKTKKLRADTEEKSGNIIRVIMPILTSFFGIWLGITDFLFQGERTIQQLIVVILCIASISILVGFLSYRSTIQKSNDVCIQEELINLQILLLAKMIDKKLHEQVKLENRLHRLTRDDDFNSTLSEKIRTFYFKKFTYIQAKAILNLIKNPVKNAWKNIFGSSAATSLFLRRKLFNLKQLLISKIHRAEQLEQINGNDELMHNLKKSFLAVPKPSLKFSSWLYTQIQSLLIEALPVFLGTFGATFMFMTAIPSTLKKIGVIDPTHFINQTTIKFGILILAISFTLYLGISQSRAIYKSWLRSKALEKLHITASQKEIEYRQLAQDIASIKKIYYYCLDIANYLQLATSKNK